MLIFNPLLIFFTLLGFNFALTFLLSDKKLKICTATLFGFIGIFQFIIHSFALFSYGEYFYKLGFLTLELVYSHISAVMILLTSLVMFFVALDVFTSIKRKINLYIRMIILIYFIILLAFLTNNLLFFYICFELSIIPLFVIILGWGGDYKLQASIKFFIYTILSSLLILLPILLIYYKLGTFELHEILYLIQQVQIEQNFKMTIFISILIGCLIKMPTFPFHTWLPSAHVEAPTGGSMILAGIMLKLGGYFLISFIVPIFRYEIMHICDYAIMIGLISLFYASFAALAQNDIKKIIAYSSIAHMSYVVCGIFVMNKDGLNGAVFQMFSHGIVASGLFYMIGIIYSRTHTRDIKCYGYIYKMTPLYSKFIILFSLASIGLPGTIGFIGELYTIVGLSQYSIYFAFLLSCGCLISCIYMLRFLREFLYTRVTEDENSTNIAHCKIKFNMSACECICCTFIGVIVILYGIHPRLII